MKTLKPTQCILIVITFILAQYFSSCSNTRDLACPDFSQPKKHSQWYYTGLFSKNKNEHKIKTTQPSSVSLLPKNKPENVVSPKIISEDVPVIIQEEAYASNEKFISVTQKAFKKPILKKLLKKEFPMLMNTLEKTKHYPPYPNAIQKPQFEISEDVAIIMAFAATVFSFAGFTLSLLGAVTLPYILTLLVALPLSIFALWLYPDNEWVWAWSIVPLLFGLIYALGFFVLIGVLTKAGSAKLFWTIFWTTIILLFVWGVWKGRIDLI